jgi:predicted homoserine dehydrogenase-like protein
LRNTTRTRTPLYKRWHLIGLEVGMSVASVALRGEPTGVACAWNADVVATAKRDLHPGELLDGEGGYTVWGKLLPAATSCLLGSQQDHQRGGLPLGLAHGIKVVRPVPQGQTLSWADVAVDTSTAAYQLRQEMQRQFAPHPQEQSGAPLAAAALARPPQGQQRI